tara:strand:- start:44 stop:424 length:381 start_codon:yes stop_codon:yes gene_type:complete
MSKKKMLIPLETYTGLISDVRSALSVASYHLKYQIEKNEPPNWGLTQVPVLCDYYSCLSALKEMLEVTLLDDGSVVSMMERILLEEGETNGIVVTQDELAVVNVLTREAQSLKDSLRVSGLSMEIH